VFIKIIISKTEPPYPGSVYFFDGGGKSFIFEKKITIMITTYRLNTNELSELIRKSFPGKDRDNCI
jgi:hypothetical protein